MSTPVASRLRGEFHVLRVADVSRLCDDAVAVTFAVPDELAGAYAFRAGQSLTLRRTIDGREERRSYSICSPEGTAPRIGVREVPDGLFSTWLVHDLRPGDEVEVGTPTGNFTPEPGVPGRHVLIAAGSGITPMLSIAATVLREPDASVTLLYGNRRADTVMFADDIADLKDRHPARLELIHVLSREPREAELFTGRLDPAKLAALGPLLGDLDAVDHWWLCGPFELVTAARDHLVGAGVAEDRIHLELFFVDDAPPAPVRHPDAAVGGAASEVTVVLDGRATTISLSRDASILDGAQRSRPDLPFACKGGVCGTCRALVTRGEVDMRRNFALERSEVDAGFVLTCQSLPCSDEVTVDYDA
ncbi:MULTISPECIES: 1,2-phenylacetyl-CoA epoxidase subunit PaaE [unclassified Saccharopolyspora]|uniref:1,2-phenylacetyl-CoA epoxidase subunit PaaE n=1 Tax=unclassified Saccharopolyspora TaxID=2646250 RepID=UPI001CD1DC99|nr:MULTISPECIES: 1,2-phenylacetyl-CoA epoxidase subunit PaaE [unclassified Saccharopolyspora]MCA1187568.1 phenylacetate-CoA oxygenase/reductase subunit PaaK [Saccharopolyspora sp. 6T]MCA1191985.1 phenylacetate-CoA oxygenase/reductase subunit PaaK [Saccharopolyspora sp. 6V]MCA1224907.1 phenylacetate-CoA oxygenase/reductase subunit PaaK [Saccharopolyspora sp. 6M]